MEEQLEKIDIIRERLGVSYREAKEALDECGGDLVSALVRIEENKSRGWTDMVFEKGDEIAGQVKTYIDKGNRTRLKLKRGDKTIAQFPATVGVIGLLAAFASAELAVAAGIGAVAAIANDVSLEIEKPDGDTKVISLAKHRENKDVDF